MKPIKPYGAIAISFFLVLLCSQNTLAQKNSIYTSDDVSLYYKDWGKGKPLVFLHSWGVNSDIWQYQMNQLASSGFRCIAYDRRGHGRSSQPWNGYDYDTLSSDLNSIIEDLRLENVTLISHSMAGGEIIRYLSKYGSGKIAQIILTSPNLPFMLKTDDNPFGLDKEAITRFTTYLQADIHATVRAGVTSFFGENPTVSQDMVEWGLSLFGQTSLQALIECNKSNIQTDFRTELKQISVPTLIIHGDADVSAPISFTAGRIKKLIPHAKLKVYEGAPHGIILTHKEQMIKDIESFLKETEN
ncbi:alpha/beta fold hydrolase [Flagellimonas olearia]|uniref:Alpha/beta fold hydrolase n=1 Tax=Flagellimonas olearia TaxID=552546 RepID=A0A6I1E354_9FLAO|nr:alpha/beta hydrolase [Allomuricauda olearia]KAB7530360.1 alpha/beta fold hydrolase [Allomuricauda olearia]